MQPWASYFSIFKPTWATNILGARFIWTELGQPTPPKSTTELGHVVRWTKKNAENDAKYKITRPLELKNL
jgi:hypothetical protein